jgi:hypothetical protein
MSVFTWHFPGSVVVVVQLNSPTILCGLVGEQVEGVVQLQSVPDEDAHPSENLTNEQPDGGCADAEPLDPTSTKICPLLDWV